MQVNINWNKTVDGFSERLISADLEEYNEITLALNERLESLENRLENYKQSEDERLKEFISTTEDKIERLKSIIEILQ